MKKLFFLFACTLPLLGFSEEAIVISHDNLPSYGKAGARLTGLATASMGAKQHEVWRSSLAPGECTPIHTHDTEETFIYLSGKGKVVMNGQETYFEAPCTVICPPNVEHQFFNVGDEPSDHIVILTINSTIVDHDQVVMHLPWRN